MGIGVEKDRCGGRGLPYIGLLQRSAGSWVPNSILNGFGMLTCPSPRSGHKILDLGDPAGVSLFQNVGSNENLARSLALLVVIMSEKGC